MQTTIDKTTIPNELQECNQWVMHKSKIPHQINGEKASPTDSNTWTSYASTLEHKSNFDGVGFVLTENDPYTVIDLDDCIINGEIQSEAKMLMDTLDSYTEYSQSGKGLHIFIKAKKPGERSKNADKGIEIYDGKRYIVTTGNHVEGTPLEINERQDTLNFIYDMYLGATNPIMDKPENNANMHSPQMSDDEVISKIRNSKHFEKFSTLYDKGDIHAYHGGDDSAADFGLANILAFWTQEGEQLERIMRKSALYRPEKWDRRESYPYIKRTIDNAVNDLTATYQKQNNYQLHVKDAPELDLNQVLKERRFEELALMLQEWEENGGKGRKPTTISPIRCSVILLEYISFVLFDLEENTRLAMYLPKEGIYTRNTTLIKRVISWLEPKLNNSKAEDVIYHLTNSADIKEETNSRYLIPVRNGVFNLKTKQLEPFSPSYVFTTKIATAYVDNPSNPVIDGWDIESWLGSIACGDQEIKNLLWQVINDALNGNYTRTKSIFLIGEGNNGKGTYQELITNLLGAKNIATLKVNEFEQRFKLGMLEGKTAVIGDDVPAGVYIDDSSNFNSVVTGDRVQVELKNKNPYNAVFRCAVIQSTNGMPKFRNKTDGSYRRLLIVPFKANFNGTAENAKIKNEYIKDERVLQYALHKAINMDFERFDVPQASLNELDLYKQDNDPVLDFKVSVFDEWNVHKLPNGLVYDFYKKFCQDNGYKPLSDRQFHKQFRKHLGKEWNPDSSGRFDAHDLMDALDETDMYGIRFFDKTKKQRAYENTKLQII